MLTLSDLQHLPQLDPFIQRILHEDAGVTIVAGFSPRPNKAIPPSGAFLSSGRSAIFNILLHEILEAQPELRALVITQDEKSYRLPRGLFRRVSFTPADGAHSPTRLIQQAGLRRSGMLVVDQIDGGNLSAILEAAARGQRILTQVDSVLSGSDVLRQLVDLGTEPGQLAHVRWVLSVMRVPTLCPYCKAPHSPLPGQVNRLLRTFPDIPAETLLSPVQATLPIDLPQPVPAFWTAAGCERCNQGRYYGDTSVFDVFYQPPGSTNPLEQESALPWREYLLHLAKGGYLAVDDLFQFEAGMLRRTYHLLAAGERSVAESHTAIRIKLAELEAANRVLQKRTETLVSLQDIAETLIASSSLADLARRVCRHACKLCGADHAILYYLRAPGQAEILAVNGWEAGLSGKTVDASLLLGVYRNSARSPQAIPFAHTPPGVSASAEPAEKIRSGYLLPLIAEEAIVGLMTVQAVRKLPFNAGEVTLLQTLANQAALAIQRAGLVEQLRDRLEQLEAAQAELIEKERLERELDLAREVQQSVLPLTFPILPGYTFAARSQPARQVGGDFYDIFRIDEDHYGLVVADVSDKGMPAALFMTMTRSVLLAEAHRSLSPAEVLSNVNRLLMEIAPNTLLVSVFYGILDAPKRRLTYARAGHDRPLLLRAGAARSLPGLGRVLGVMEDLALTEDNLELESGDRLVLYSDGMTDLITPAEQPFGLEQFTTILQSYTHLPAGELVEATFNHLSAYQEQAGQYDDMTMLVVEVTSKL